MTLFTIISGYWYKNKSFMKLLLQFLWPCVIFTVINGVLGYFFYPNYWVYFKFKPGYAMWYLMALFLYSIATKQIRRYFGSITYLLIALFIAFVIGCIPISNNYFEIQRISCLYPCFAFGVVLREYAGNQLLVDKFGSKIPNIRKKCTVLLVLIILCNIAIIHCFPAITGAFKAYYGLNMIAALEKWGLMFMRVVYQVWSTNNECLSSSYYPDFYYLLGGSLWLSLWMVWIIGVLCWCTFTLYVIF